MNLTQFYRVFLIAVSTHTICIAAYSQSPALKNLEAAVAAARTRVEMNEKKVADADSVIAAGRRMISESKAGLKAVDSESRKLEKEYAAQRKSLTRLSKSGDRTVANKAKSDLRLLETHYKTGNRELETRFRDATRLQTTGISALQRGRTARKNAMDGLRAAGDALKVSQAKYDKAAGTEKDDGGKNRK